MKKKENRAAEAIFEIADDQLPCGLIRSDSGLPCFRPAGHVLTSQMVKDAESAIDDHQMKLARKVMH